MTTTLCGLPSLVWRLEPDVEIGSASGCAVEIAVAERKVRLPVQTAGDFERALRLLADGGSEDALLAVVGPSHGPELYDLLMLLVHADLVKVSALLDGVSLARLIPQSGAFSLPSGGVLLPQRLELVRSVQLRASNLGAVLEGPGISCGLLIEDAGCGALVARLAVSALDQDSVCGGAERAMLGLLIAIGAVRPVSGQESSAISWEFHDGLFHWKTRTAPYDVHVGIDLPRDASVPPSERDEYDGEIIPLSPLPTGELTRSHDLLSLMERSHSSRDMGLVPPELDELGEILYRVARVSAVGNLVKSRERRLLRPIPAGGAAHELEFYVAVRSCIGLAPGFYHYHDRKHVLVRVRGSDATVTSMLQNCATSWGRPESPPHVLIVLSVRLGCLQAQYRRIAYRLALLNAGVALQSLYLVVADLGLVGCAAGSGDSRLFARATGCDPEEETSIAEFGLGRGPL